MPNFNSLYHIFIKFLITKLTMKMYIILNKIEMAQSK